VTNFDFLFGEKKFSCFSGAAAAAEKICGIDAAACAVNARRAAELAVKWMYENDRALPKTKRDQLAALTGASEFRQVAGAANVRALDYIRRVGNNAAHNPDMVTKEQAELSLKNLYDFTFFMAKKYSKVRPIGAYDKSLLDPEAELVTEAFSQQDIRELLAENRAMKRMLANLRREKDEEIPAARTSLSEADTRRLYTETALAHAGWRIGVNCFAEYPLRGLPTQNGVGYADYVLCNPDGTPVALIESQAVDEDVALGRQQAKLYADALEKKTGIRPVIFLTNGLETRVWFDSESPERPIGGFYSPSDLIRIRSLRHKRRLPEDADYEASKVRRPYQLQAIRAAADAFCRRKERTVFLSMAPGTGKTRTALAAADLLRRCSWAEHVLFLCENDLLCRQAQHEFTSAFPGWRTAAITDHADAAEAEIIFATFENLPVEADELTDKNGMSLLTAGRFDLIICDETDRRTVLQCQDAFHTFDAPVLALSSAPGGMTDPLLCDLLNTIPGQAAFSYSYDDAVRDGWIAAFTAADVFLSLLSEGIHAGQLSPTERQSYDKIFTDRGENIPDSIPASALFTEYFNTDTVHLALEYLREHGRYQGSTLGKTIIFTENLAHSEMIYAEWAKLFPADPPHFCRVVDASINYARSLVEDFIRTDSMPQVAVSHDLLFDGVNMPAVENLVFFTRAASRATFWRMLGRGMRRCTELPDGKPTFFVLDLCGNFRSFGGEDDASESEPLPVQSRNFAAQVRIAAQLQTLSLGESGTALRTTLVRSLHRQIKALDPDSFSVRRRLAALTPFRNEEAFTALTPRDITALCRDIAPLMQVDGTTERAALFNEQMYAIILARLQHKPYEDSRAEVLRTVRALAQMATHRKIALQKKTLNRILYNKYLDQAPVPELETARRAIEPLIQYLPTEDAVPLRTYFTDRILSVNNITEKGMTT